MQIINRAIYWSDYDLKEPHKSSVHFSFDLQASTISTYGVNDYAYDSFPTYVLLYSKYLTTNINL